MLNANSPIVQSMIKNMPPNVLNNMEFYNGSPPTVETTYTTPFQQQVIQNPPAQMYYLQNYVYPSTPVGYPNQAATPYPSPRDMVINQAAQVYQPTPFAPRNIVGQYNPGYQQVFAGYSNPYMGYTQQQQRPKYIIPNEIANDIAQAAFAKHISFDEQAELDSEINKMMSRIVNRYLNKSEEEIKEREKQYDLKPYETVNRNITQYSYSQPINFHIQIVQGDEVLLDSKVEEPKEEENDSNSLFGIANSTKRKENYYLNRVTVERMEQNIQAASYNRIMRNNRLYETAIERQFDNTPILDFFNKSGYKVLEESMRIKLKLQNLSRISESYNSQEFRKKLLEKNGIRPKEEQKAIDRFYGRYGIMPDGRPVSPGHDPSIADSFSYNPVTGVYDITAPKFIRDRIENARRSFVQSIDTR